MKRLIIIPLLLAAFSSDAQDKEWRVVKTDTTGYVPFDTFGKWSNTPGWAVDSLWVEDTAYTKTQAGREDTIKRRFFQYRLGQTSGYYQRRAATVEKVLFDKPKSRVQQIIDSFNNL